MYFISLLVVLPHLSDPPPGNTGDIPDYAGEIMQYKLKYGIFHIGFASISFLDDKEECGINIIAGARSTGLVKLIKDIDYRYEACMDPVTGLPKNASQKLRDGRHNLYNELVFDQHSRLDSAIVYSMNTGKNVVQKGIHDILTGFFQFRKNHINECQSPGDSVVIKTFFMDEGWDLNIRYDSKETISTNYGQIDCLRLLPETIVGGFFRTRNAMTVWFTRDESSIPVKIKLDLFLGSVQGNLVSYKNPEKYKEHLIIK